MPDIRVSNQTSEVLNIGFWFVAPLAFVNEVQPSQTITLHLASVHYKFEARRDNGSNRFSADESRRKAKEIVGAVAAGTIVVVAGSVWVLGALGRLKPLNAVAYTSARAAWGEACRAGAAYATPAEAVVTNVEGVYIPFKLKNFSVRFVDGKYVLWDDDDDRLIG